MFSRLGSLFERPFSPQRFFLLVSGFLGFLMVFIVPPFQAPDEHTHFYKEVFQSRGHLIAKVIPYRVGAYLPAKYTEPADRYKYMFLDSEKKLDFNILKSDIRRPIADNQPAVTAFENTAQYPPLAYVPQSLAIFITHLFSGSVLMQLYAARFGTLITWLVLVYFAIKYLPFSKWGAVALTLTPLSIFLSVSSSNDAITFGLTLLFISLALRSIVSLGTMRRNEKLQLMASGFALGLCKPPYLILTLLSLVIPASRFPEKRARLKFLLMLLLGTIFLAALWNLMVKNIIINFYPGSSTSGQINYILQHPISSLVMIVKTLIIYPIGDDMILQLVGLKAWMAAQTPFWLIMLDYVVIVLAIIYSPARTKITAITRQVRILSALLLAGGVLMVAGLLYITYTPVGAGTIVGLQGRYFIPFSYLLIPLLGGWAGLRLSSDRNNLLKVLILLIALSTLPLTISRYYLG